MTNIKEIETDTLSIKDNHLQATFYQPTATELTNLVLYFHGGGLIFGSRNDLPTEYIELFLNNGVGVIAVDYPLAPTYNTDEIIYFSQQITEWFVDYYDTNDLHVPYYIFGRSAGGFLALHAGLHAQTLDVKPEGLILLYSYFNLNDAAFSVPSRYYQQYPVANEMIIQKLMKQAESTLTQGEANFPLYLYGRQTGKWMDMLTSNKDDLKKFSLNKEDIQKLPPLYISSATDDTDVPSRQSKQLANFHPKSTLKMIPVTAHDFDRTSPEIGIEVYQEIIHWMEEPK